MKQEGQRRPTGDSRPGRDHAMVRASEEALRESQKTLETFLNATTDVAFLIDTSGTILAHNEAAAKFLRKGKKQALGRRIADFMTPEMAERSKECAIKVIQTGQPVHYEIDYQGMCVENRIYPIFDDGGRVIKLAVYGRNITERKRANEALKESEQRFRDIIYSMADWVWEVDEKGVYTFCSPKVQDVLGYSPAEIIGKTPFDLMAPEEVKRVKKVLSKITAGKRPIQGLENWNISKDGKRICLLTNAIPIFDPRGKFRGYRGVDKDITERKLSEEKLRESEKRYRLLAENVTDVIWTMDTNLRVTFVSPSVFPLLGYHVEDSIGKIPRGVLTATSFQTARKVLAEELAVERMKERDLTRSRTLELEVICKDGCTIWTEVRVTFLRDLKGRPMEILGVARDITERKRAEVQLKHSREQLRAFSAKMEMIREEERARIAREIHDELGQGLTALKMDLVWLTNRLSQEPKMLRQRTRTMSKLIDSTIQSVRRISSELRPGVLDDLGLTAAIEWGSREFQKRTGIQHQFRSNKEEFDLTKDCATAIFRIFQEALTNVTRHARATRINVNLEENAGSLILEIRDNGTGITEKEISNPKSMGLLGMRERALLFGGEIKISGAPGEGTTVRLEIPLKKPMNGKKEGHRPGRMRRRG